MYSLALLSLALIHSDKCGIQRRTHQDDECCAVENIGDGVCTVHNIAAPLVPFKEASAYYCYGCTGLADVKAFLGEDINENAALITDDTEMWSALVSFDNVNTFARTMAHKIPADGALMVSTQYFLAAVFPSFTASPMHPSGASTTDYVTAAQAQLGSNYTGPDPLHDRRMNFHYFYSCSAQGVANGLDAPPVVPIPSDPSKFDISSFWNAPMNLIHASQGLPFAAHVSLADIAARTGKSKMYVTNLACHCPYSMNSISPRGSLPWPEDQWGHCSNGVNQLLPLIKDDVAFVVMYNPTRLWAWQGEQHETWSTPDGKCVNIGTKLPANHTTFLDRLAVKPIMIEIIRAGSGIQNPLEAWGLPVVLTPQSFVIDVPTKTANLNFFYDNDVSCVKDGANRLTAIPALFHRVGRRSDEGLKATFA